MSKLKIKELFGQIAEVAQKVETRINEVNAEIASLNQSRQELIDEHLSHADFMALVRADVKSRAIHYERELLKWFGKLPRGIVAADRRSMDFAYIPYGNEDAALCCLMEDQIVERVGGVLLALEWPDESTTLPIEQRRTKLGKLDRAILQVDTERNELIELLKAYQIVQ